VNLTSTLSELVLVCGVGVLAALLLSRLKLPIVTGLLAAGAVVGPHGFAMVRDPHGIEMLAEVGVVLLLFTIGLEFSLSRLTRIGRLVAVGGALQVGMTTLVTLGVLLAIGETWQRGVFFGFLIALSSTAIVLRALGERGEMNAPHGRFVVGALIFQDLCVVPMMLLVPVLAGKGGASPGREAAIALGKAALVVVGTLVISRWLVPRAFAIVDRARSREIFLLAICVVCLGTAWLTSLTGLSLALGAFLAGMVVADSDYAHRALSEMLPLRDLLTSIFFVSLGMLFDVRVLLEAPVAVGLVFAGILVGKALVAAIACMAMRFPPQVAVLAGVGLAQFGEFGFVLARAGAELGMLQRAEERVLLGAAVLTMLVTPVAVRLAPRLAAGAQGLKRLAKLVGAPSIDEAAPEHAEMHDHVIVVGYGVAGRVLASALRETSTPYLVLELNADTVHRARAGGEPVYYGDISSPDSLAHAHAERARAVVLLINDPAAAERAVAASRAHAPDTPIFVRVHYVKDAARLRALGASEVVVEEVESGIEMLGRVLARTGVSRDVVRARLAGARAATAVAAGDGPSRPSAPSLDHAAVGALAAQDVRLESYLVEPRSEAAGRTLVEIELRARTGASALALQRDGTVHEPVDPAAPLEPGDRLFLAGSKAALSRAAALLVAHDTEIDCAPRDGRPPATPGASE
jgi:CPA2 family monovalent cation:H+ antiporter-2